MDKLSAAKLTGICNYILSDSAIQVLSKYSISEQLRLCRDELVNGHKYLTSFSQPWSNNDLSEPAIEVYNAERGYFEGENGLHVAPEERIWVLDKITKA